MLIPCGVRLKVRADRPAGVVRASFAADDGSWEAEVSTLSVALADADRSAFDAWVRALSQALNRMVSDALGVPLDDITSRAERPPGH